MHKGFDMPRNYLVNAVFGRRIAPHGISNSDDYHRYLGPASSNYGKDN
jgi:hypothetical protein